MRRRLLDLCLLAYPRAHREHDRDYLRDLALDLSEASGLRRQALSLLRGGIRDRLEARDRRRRAGPSAWMKRVVVAFCMLAALAFAATNLIAPAAGDGERVELERVVCVYKDHPTSKPTRANGDAAAGCAEERELVAARVRGGWDCATRRRILDGKREIAWRCALGQELVAWRAS